MPGPGPEQGDAVEILIVTGMSGAGKTAALKCLEDLGYFAIDNLPASLLGNVVDMAPGQGQRLERVAVGMDVRAGGDFAGLFTALEGIESIPHAILFLDASNEVLLRRFAETRRLHPLDSDGLRVADNIARERRLLQPLRERADMVLDTTSINIHELREQIKTMVPHLDECRSTRVNFISFGYKYGHPMDADMVFDARFMPNPYWVDELRDLTGGEEPVREYVMGEPEAGAFLDNITSLLNLVLPSYQRERRPYLTVAVGCTGGRHRSVVIAGELARRFSEVGVDTCVVHRDVNKK